MNPADFPNIVPWHPVRYGVRRGPAFDLHAGVVVAGGDRARLERVSRYALRPPVARDRIRLTAEGQVRLELRHRWADGTTHLLFDPVELLERLAALTPRPRTNLILYYGVLGAIARPIESVLGAVDAAERRRRCLSVPAVRGRLRLVALIEEARVIRRIRLLSAPVDSQTGLSR